MIRNKTLLILAAVALCMVAITTLLYTTRPSQAALGFQSGMALIQGLAPEKVNAIELARGKETITLKRSPEGDAFLLAERSNYPASLNLVNQLFINALDIRCREKITDKPENYATLGVADDYIDKLTVRFLDADGKMIIGFIRGKGSEKGGGCYVRLIGQPAVYVTEKYANFDTIPMKYLEPRILQAKKEDVKRVEVKNEKGGYAVRRDDKNALALEGVPEGKRVKPRVLDDIINFAANVSFSDVVPADKIDVKWDSSCILRLPADLAYTIKFGGKDGKNYAQVSATGPDVVSVRITPDEAKEELKKKEAILLARDAAIECNKRNGPWVYQVDTWMAGRLGQSRDNLIEDIPAPGDEIEVSHILVTWKGALRADDNISRDKDAALLLANDVLAKCKAPNADWEKLVKRYSDDIDVRVRGQNGDMGPVRKGAMDPRFEKLAFALKPGEIANEPAETRLGYHVIKRIK